MTPPRAPRPGRRRDERGRGSDRCRAHLPRPRPPREGRRPQALEVPRADLPRPGRLRRERPHPPRRPGRRDRARASNRPPRPPGRGDASAEAARRLLECCRRRALAATVLAPGTRRLQPRPPRPRARGARRTAPRGRTARGVGVGGLVRRNVRTTRPVGRGAGGRRAGCRVSGYPRMMAGRVERMRIGEAVKWRGRDGRVERGHVIGQSARRPGGPSGPGLATAGSEAGAMFWSIITRCVREAGIEGACPDTRSGSAPPSPSLRPGHRSSRCKRPGDGARPRCLGATPAGNSPRAAPVETF